LSKGVSTRDIDACIYNEYQTMYLRLQVTSRMKIQNILVYGDTLVIGACEYY